MLKDDDIYQTAAQILSAQRGRAGAKALVAAKIWRHRQEHDVQGAREWRAVGRALRGLAAP